MRNSDYRGRLGSRANASFSVRTMNREDASEKVVNRILKEVLAPETSISINSQDNG